MGKILKLKDICEIEGGYAFKSSRYKTEGVPLIRIGDISDKSIDISEKSVYIDDDIDKYKKFIINKGDILIALSGATTGKFGIYKYEDKALLNQRVAKIYPNELIENRYLYHYMNKLKDIIYDKAAGCAQPNISPNEVGEIEIYVPSIETQKKIVEVLDKSQSLIEKKKEQIDLLDELVKSRFIDMFGNPISNSKNLKMKNFEEVIVLQRGYDLPTYKRDETGKYNVWGANGVLSKHSEYKIKEYGVITGRSGSLGKVYYTKEPYWPLNTTLFSKDTCGNNVVYLTYLLRFYDLERFSNGTGVPTLNRNLLNGQKIIDVPIELQNEFAEFVTKIGEIKSKMETSLSELEDNFNSLMQKAFKGELFI